MTEKPSDEFTYRCVTCGQKWKGSQLILDPQFTASDWPCPHPTCGGMVLIETAAELRPTREQAPRDTTTTPREKP